MISETGRDSRHYCVTLIHGTWGSGAAFLKAESIFQSDLRERFGSNITFTRSSWSGRNSQKARLEGQQKLQSDLSSILQAHPNSIHVLAAHSHGGNTALYALNNPSLNRQISGLICMGTPFITRLPRNIVMPSILFGLSCAGFVAFLFDLLFIVAHAFIAEDVLSALVSFLFMIVLFFPASLAMGEEEPLTLTRLLIFVTYIGLALSVPFDRWRSFIESSWILSHLAGIAVIAAELIWIAAWTYTPGAYCGHFLYNYLRRAQRTVVSLYPSQRDHHIPILNLPVEFDEVWVGLGLLWNVGDFLLKLCHWAFIGSLVAAAAFAFTGFSLYVNTRNRFNINPFFENLQLIPATFFNALAGVGLLFGLLFFAYTLAAILNILSRQHPLGFGIERPSLQWVARIRTSLEPDPSNEQTNSWSQLDTRKYTIRQVIACAGWKGLLLLRHSWMYSSRIVVQDIAAWMATLEPRQSPNHVALPQIHHEPRPQSGPTLFDGLLWITSGLAVVGCLWLLPSFYSYLHHALFTLK
jgi:hypothetical protein